MAKELSEQYIETCGTKLNALGRTKSVYDAMSNIVANYIRKVERRQKAKLVEFAV